jgi:hypothetical protein
MPKTGATVVAIGSVTPPIVRYAMPDAAAVGDPVVWPLLRETVVGTPGCGSGWRSCSSPCSRGRPAPTRSAPKP